MYKNFKTLARGFPTMQFDAVEGLEGLDVMISTGLRALLHILWQRPTTVTILGFDLHSSRAFPGYYPAELEEQKGQSPAHSTTYEMALLARKLREHPNLFIDSHLERVMTSNGHRVPASQVAEGAAVRPGQAVLMQKGSRAGHHAAPTPDTRVRGSGLNRSATVY